MYVAGIDAHSTYLVVGVVSNTGELVHPPTRIANTQPDELLQRFRPVEAVVETSPAWPWLYELLRKRGVGFVLAHAKKLRDDVARRFGLGSARKNWQRVEGGLSNRLWRLDTDVGSFAIKQMIAGTEKPDFQRNLNASYEVESAAIAQGVAAPRPVSPLPGSGCLASIPSGQR